MSICVVSVRPPSRASSAPTGVAVFTAFVYTTKPVGAELARDEATRYTADFTTDALGRIEHNP